MQDRIIYALFALSGISGLLYEGTWARYLKLFLGHSSYGQILTLSIYMGGLGIGSFIAAKMLPKIQNPFKAYAITELAIGMGGFVYHFLYEHMTNWFYSGQWSAQMGSEGAKAIKIVLAVASTTPWAILLGMTFPFIAAALARRHADEGSLSIPRLYFTNSAGAAVGLLLASYLLIPALGTHGTLILAAILNLALGLSFYFYAPPVGLPPMRKANSTVDLEGFPKASVWLTIAFITGLTSFIYEVVWIRLLSLMMGSSTHSFDLMVSAFILGLALGGYYSRKLAHRDSISILAWVQVLMGFFAVSTIYTYPLFFEAMNLSNLLFRQSEVGYQGWSILKYAMSILWMVPTSFFAGMTLPLITWSLSRRSSSDQSVGAVYGFNTFGAITGALLGGMLLIPILQLKWSLWMAASLDVLLGVLLFLLYRRQALRQFKLWLLVLAIVPATLIEFDAHMVTAGMFRGFKEYMRYEKVYVENGRTATISFHESPVHGYIKTNGKPDASIRKDRNKPVEGDELTQAATALIPMATRNEPYEAGMVGFGSGMSAYYLLADPLLQRLDVVEIEGKMLELANRFRPVNARAFDDPRVNLYIDDARTFFHTHRRQYDILVSVPSNPWVSGVSSLFSEEFYHHIRRYIKPKGVLVQWLQLYEFDNSLLLHILKALDKSFPYVALYRIPDEPDIIMLASDHPIRQEHIQRFVTTDSIQAEFGRMHRPWWFFGEQNFLATNKTLAPLLKHIEPNSEYIPWVDNRAESMRWANHSVQMTYAFDSCLVCWPQLLDPEDYAPRKAFRDWIQSANKPDAYLEGNLLHHLQAQQSGTARVELWENIWNDMQKYALQVPASPLRDSLPIYKLMRNLVDQGRVPLAYSLHFELEDHLIHQRYREAASMLKAMREVFVIGTMESTLQRQIALAAFLSGDTRELRGIWNDAYKPTVNLDNAEKKLIAELLHIPHDSIPMNSPEDLSE